MFGRPELKLGVKVEDDLEYTNIPDSPSSIQDYIQNICQLRLTFLQTESSLIYRKAWTRFSGSPLQQKGSQVQLIKRTN
jgi:hypothetical protein